MKVCSLDTFVGQPGYVVFLPMDLSIVRKIIASLKVSVWGDEEESAQEDPLKMPWACSHTLSSAHKARLYHANSGLLYRKDS